MLKELCVVCHKRKLKLGPAFCARGLVTKWERNSFVPRDFDYQNVSYKDRDNAVIGYGLRALISGNNYCFQVTFKPALGPTRPSVHWVSDVLSPGVKRPGFVIFYSSPLDVRVKKAWTYISRARTFMVYCMGNILPLGAQNYNIDIYIYIYII